MNKIFNVVLLLLLGLVFSKAEGAGGLSSFKFTVNTNNMGVSNNKSFTIPTLAGQPYEYSVDCDADGDLDAVSITDSYTCKYANIGTYQISILGDLNNGQFGFPAIYFNNSGDRLKILSIDQWGIGEWSTMAGAFWGASNMTVLASDVPNLDDASDLAFMFNGAILANPNTSNWGTGNITKMTGMFQGATSATPNVSNWDTGNVELMNFMFAGATSVNPDMSSWDIGEVTDMTGMFHLVSLTTSTFDAALRNFSSQLINSNVNFNAGNSQYCAISQHLNLSNTAINNWQITDNGTATGCQSSDDFLTGWTPIADGIITIPTTGSGYYYRVDWNNDGDMNDVDESTIYTGNASHNYGNNIYQTIAIKGVFPRIHLADGSERAKLKDILQWGDVKWTSMENAFRGAENLHGIPVTPPDLSNATSFNHMFADATIVPFSSTDGIGQWDTSTITDMSYMFQNALAANPDVSLWDTSNVVGMRSMFDGATNAEPDTSLWDTSNVNDMQAIFKNAINANPNTSLWITSGVTRMDYMFDGAVLAIPDTSNWDTSSVQSMDYMFRNVEFANPDTSNWDVHNVKLINNGIVADQRFGFRGMFSGVKLTTDTYDNLLNNFAGSSSLHSSLEFDGGTSNLCSSVSAKFFLENQENWTITDAGQVCSSETNDFIIVVKTDNPGVTVSTKFKVSVPTIVGSSHNYNIACHGNNFFEGTGVTNGFECNYLQAGVYRIRIVDNSGNGTGFPFIHFNNAGDRLKILDIRQWGTGKWATMENAFWGASNMIVTANDAPDLTNTTSLEGMFRGATRANPYTKTWNVSNITTMRSMFAGAENADPDTSTWNTEMITDMSLMFWQAFSSNPDMSSWDIGQIGTMQNMFVNVTLPISTYDAALINFNTQVHPSNINWNVGNSQYCDGLDAHADLISDGWNIQDLGQECTPNRPIAPPIQLTSPNDNTPNVRSSCSELNNFLKIYLTDPNVSNPLYSFTHVATYLCQDPLVVGNAQSFTITAPVQDGHFFMQVSEVKNGDESTPSFNSPGTNLIIDTMTPDPTLIALSSNPASNGTTVELVLEGVESGATVTVTGMVCGPLLPLSSFYSCFGVVGEDGFDGTNNTITIVDNLGNSNTNNSTGLVVDNTAPFAPVVFPVNAADLHISGTAEVGSVITLTGATCSNSPVIAIANGTWNCVTSGLVAGTVISATAADDLGNESDDSVGVIVSGTDNTPPNAPVINPVTNLSTVISGTSEALATIIVSGASCTNSPVADVNGDWVCNISPLAGGTNLTATATDAAGNVSDDSDTVIVSISSSFIYANGFE